MNFLHSSHPAPGGREPRTTVWRLALPAVVEQFLLMLVGLTDHALLGHLAPAVGARWGYDRATALAGVGLGNLVVGVVTVCFSAVAVGVTSIVARRTGERNREAAEATLAQGLWLGALVGALAMLVALTGAQRLLGWMGAAPEVAAVGGDYLRLVSCSFIPVAMMQAGTAALRGAGDVRTPLLLMGGVNLVHTLLAAGLVNGVDFAPGLGVMGAAVGAVTGRTLGGVALVALLLSGRCVLRPRPTMRPDGALLRKLLRVGGPFAVEQLSFQGAIVFMARLISGLGTASYAAHSTVLTLESVSFLPGLGFGSAATLLVGQALGARDVEWARRCAAEALRQGALLMGGLGLVMVAFPEALVRLLTSDAGVVQAAVIPLLVAGLGQPLLAVIFTVNGALRGAADTRFSMYVRIGVSWGVRLVLALLLVRRLGWGLEGVWLAMACDWVAQAGLVLWRWRSGAWSAIKV